MLYRRQVYRAKFWNAKSIRISAVNEAQARYIAEGVAKKHGYKLESIGRI